MANIVAVPDWLLERFSNMHAHSPHYEASFYGPITMLLTTYFPAKAQFMVKPQPRLRRSPEPLGRTSIDSYSQSVGTHDDDLTPDFLVSVGTSDLHSDVPLIIIEVKREGEEFSSAFAQLDRYCGWIKTYQERMAPWGAGSVAAAILVIGTECWMVQMVEESDVVNVTRIHGTGITDISMLTIFQRFRDGFVQHPIANVGAVPNWLLERFANMHADPPHYEASFYGPMAMLLATYFPAEARFMVKPQPRLRRSPEPLGRTSIDSYGQSVGTHDDDLTPDFLVSVGTSDLHSDVPLIIIEVKREGEEFSSAFAQLDRYCAWIQRYQERMAPWGAWSAAAAFLVIGTECWMVQMMEEGRVVNVTRIHGTGITDTSMLTVFERFRDAFSNQIVHV
jgi:hypothetical protein